MEWRTLFKQDVLLEALKSKSEEVSTDLRAAKTDNRGSTEKAMLSQLQKADKANLLGSGIYSLKGDRENNYKISFSPYSET